MQQNTAFVTALAALFARGVIDALVQDSALGRELIFIPCLLDMNQGELTRTIGVMLQSGDGEIVIHAQVSYSIGMAIAESMI